MSSNRISRTEVRKLKDAQATSRTLSIALMALIVCIFLYFTVYLYVDFKPIGTNIIVPLILVAACGGLVYLLIRQISVFKFSFEQQASDSISKSEGRFKALIQNSLDVISIVDLKGIITYQSPSTERVLGYVPEELVGEGLFELVHTEDHALVQNALEQKTTFMFSYRIQHKDGTWLYFESVGTNLASNPLVAGYVINSRDVTDRKKEEQEKRQKEVAALKFNMEREKAQTARENAEREKLIIEESKKQLESAYEIIEHKNQEITDSINYAFRIQTALLPPIDDIKKLLPDSLVIWRPKDIVSGDFYWFSIIDEEIEEAGQERIKQYVLLACADCTGHGVPGAFMTMIGNTLLNQIVKEKKITRPDEILNNLHLGVRRALKQDQVGSQSRDGMDVSMMRVDKEKKEVVYSAANRPMWLVKASGDEIEEFKADKQSIGGLQTETERIFTPNFITYNPGDQFYTCSDGYHDQFGGPKGRKFMTKTLKELIMEVHEKPIEEQKEIFDKRIVDWMQGGEQKYEQIDDILLVAFKV